MQFVGMDCDKYQKPKLDFVFPIKFFILIQIKKINTFITLTMISYCACAKIEAELFN